MVFRLAKYVAIAVIGFSGCSFCAIPASPQHAATHQIQMGNVQVQPVVSFSLGGQRVSGNDTTQFPVNYSEYLFTSGAKNSSKVLFGVFGGVEFQAAQNLALQLGLGYYYPLSYQFSGSLAQGVDPQSYDFLTYRYRVQTQQLFIEGKLQGTWYTKFLPYLSLGVGAAFNRAYDYSSKTMLPPFMLFTPLFANGKTNTSFIYLVGAGVDAVLSEKWRLGVGYRYNTIGKIALGPGLINTTIIANTLSQSHAYAQNILFQLTYII